MGPKAEERLVAAITADLTLYWRDNQLGAYVDLDAGTYPLDDSHVCYVDAHKLQIRFSPYEVAPYAHGPVSVDVTPLVPLMPPRSARGTLFAG